MGKSAGATLRGVICSLAASAWIPQVLGFAFQLQTTGSAVSQCGNVDIVWRGGTPPFTLTIIPAFDYPSNYTIPDSAWTSSSSSGQWSWQVNYRANVQFVAMMSDATGTGTGGVSSLYKVSGSNAQCTPRATNTDFLFYLNETTVSQCEPVYINWDTTATKPVTILGVIPQGQIFQVQSGSDNSLVWNTNIAAGTQFILAAFDEGRYKIGGSSAIMTVGSSGNSACLDDSSPSSTPVVPIASQTGSPTRTGGVIKTVTAITTAIPPGAAGLTGGAIAGIVIGVVIFLLALQFVLFWFCCRRQVMALISHRRDMRGREVKPGEVDLLADHNSLPLNSTSTPSLPDIDSGTPLHSRRESRGSNLLSGQTRSSYIGGGSGASDIGIGTSISPFFDSTPRQSLSQAQPHPGGSGHMGYDDTLLNRGFGEGVADESDFVPPVRNHTRNNSRTSTLDSPTTSFIPSSSSRGYSKAQIAASLSTTNPDPLGPGESGPPLPVPLGGIRRHLDAGRLPQSRPPPNAEVEDLPPLYNTEWQHEGEE